MPADDNKLKVSVYGADWCPPCHITKEYLSRAKINFEYFDVDKDREAGRKITQKTGWTSIPIIQIGDEFILGYDRPKLDSALRAAKLLT